MYKIFVAILSFIQISLLYGDFYRPDRLAFPPLCLDHFCENKYEENTWLEPCDKKSIKECEPFFSLIPQAYSPHCYVCTIKPYDSHEYVNDGFAIDCFADDSARDTIEYCTDSALSKLSYTLKHKLEGTQYWGSRNPIYPCRNYYDEDNDEYLDVYCWDGNYFRKWNHKYFTFFKHLLTYCSQNSKCKCLWPECDLRAVLINDSVYKVLKQLADDEILLADFSTYWTARDVYLDYSSKHKYGFSFGSEYFPNSHGIASSLTTYCFFYSQYHQMLLDVIKYIDQNGLGNTASESIDKIYDALESIRDPFFKLYTLCLKKHPHPKIYYERGMLLMHGEKFENALQDIQYLMELSKNEKYKNQNILNSDLYFQEGRAYCELGLYDDAIKSLTKAIDLDSKNKEAYFNRAIAYFETGKFDASLSDFLRSERSSEKIPEKNIVSNEFISALNQAIINGAKDSAEEFIPSLCNSVGGISNCLWIGLQQPVDSLKCFHYACNEVASFVWDALRNLDNERLQEIYDINKHDLEIFLKNYDELSDQEKGNFLGYAIGRGGIEVLAGALVGTATVKGLETLKKLKNANRLCNFEGMVSSKDTIIASSIKHTAERDLYFKNVKIEWDKQNKHVPGRHNFEKGKSILEHSDPESLLAKFAGKGKPAGSVGINFGESGYKEIVDFEEFIGYSVCEYTGVKTPTTCGKIHYSKKGAHIVPTRLKE